MQIIQDKQAVLELAYHTQKLLNEIHPDHEQISRLLEQTRKPPEPIRERQIREHAEHQLNTITDNNFQKVTENLPPYQTHILNIREQTKERERLKEIERAEKEHAHTFERGR